jgi:hypothetical protein
VNLAENVPKLYLANLFNLLCYSVEILKLGKIKETYVALYGNTQTSKITLEEKLT